MSDYAVKITIRNGRILRRMEECGFRSQADLARRTGLRMETINSLVALRRKPMDDNGRWLHGVEDVAAALDCEPYELFSEAQLGMALKSNTAQVFMDEGSVLAITSDNMEGAVWAKLEVQKLLARIEHRRDRRVIEMRMQGMNWSEVGEVLGVTAGRVCQLEIRAMRQMKIAAEALDEAEVGRRGGI